MMKALNVKGIIILLAVLLAAQLLFAFILSPILGPIIIKNINKTTGTKISVEKITVWPLTLSCSLDNLKVFNPDNENERIALVKKASLRISPIGLLSKRLVIARLGLAGAEINLKGEPDGTFNVQKLVETGEEKAARPGILDRFKKKQDWFGRIYTLVKSKASRKPSGKEPAAPPPAKKIEKEVVRLPRGRKVRFVTPRDRYVFEISDFEVKDSSIKLESASGETVDVERASFYIKNLGLDPKSGVRISDFGARGNIVNAGKSSGNFNFDYAQTFSGDRIRADLSAKNVDLTAIKFIYEDSLPVDFKKGILSINSRNNIREGELDSENSLLLEGHSVSPKNNQVVGFVPLPVVCDALNKIDEINLKFRITGTMEHPEFEGFEETLLALLKPYLTDVTKGLKEKATKALGDFFKKDSPSGEDSPSGDDAATKTMEKLKSFFGNKAGSGE